MFKDSMFRKRRELKKGGDIALDTAYELVQSELIRLRQQIAETLAHKKSLEEKLPSCSPSKRNDLEGQIQSAALVYADQRRRLAAFEVLCHSTYCARRILKSLGPFKSLRSELSDHKSAATQLALKYASEIDDPGDADTSSERIQNMFYELQNSFMSLCIQVVDDGRYTEQEWIELSESIEAMLRELSKAVQKTQNRTEQWREKVNAATQINQPDLAKQAIQRVEQYDHECMQVSKELAALIEFNRSLKSHRKDKEV